MADSAATWLLPVVVALLGGGLVAALGQFLAARAELRRVRIAEGKSGAEVESIILGGAEAAVASLQKALDRSESQIARLEALAEKRAARITELEEQLAAAIGRAGTLQARLDGIDERIAGLEDEQP